MPQSVTHLCVHVRVCVCACAWRCGNVSADAVVFFDECESLFQSRSRGGGSMVATMLTEIERFEGVLILATNRPYAHVHAAASPWLRRC